MIDVGDVWFDLRNALALTKHEFSAYNETQEVSYEACLQHTYMEFHKHFPFISKHYIYEHQKHEISTCQSFVKYKIKVTIRSLH